MSVARPPIDTTVRAAPHGWLPGGNLREFSRDRLRFMTRVAREYGDFVRLDFAGFPVYLISHPAAIEEILVSKNRSFHKGRGLGRTRRILGNGLLTSEGDFWRRQRRLAQPAFHPRRVAGYAAIMTGAIQQALAGWQDGQRRNIHADMMALTMAIAARALFDVDLAQDASAAVKDALEVALRHFNRRNGLIAVPEWAPTPENLRFERAARRLDEVVFAIIQQHREHAGGADDLLSMLLQARDTDGSQMTDGQLRDEVMTLFLAGHETTAVALSWAWMLLAQNPPAEARLHAELERVLAGRPPVVDDLPALTYTRDVIDEAMRLYPPAYVISRQALEDVEIAGVPLQAGSALLMSQWVVQRDPRWYPQPLRFIPERWEGAQALPDYAYFPFGGGPRLCIGRPFALQEAVLALATIAQRYRLELDPAREIRPRPSITLRPGGGVWVRLHRR